MFLLSSIFQVFVQHYAELFLQSVSVLFLAILFLQSGIDKVVDRSENLIWLKSHFSNSPLSNMVPLLFLSITIVELLAGLACILGVVNIILYANTVYAVVGVALSMLAILMLFFGQRMAKDYAGAQSLVAYFVLSIITFILLTGGF
ncbi:MAG: DoxX family protein [Bacteroidota bacterium]|nr:DoxX family protein [Bacteroidota bacterium]